MMKANFFGMVSIGLGLALAGCNASPPPAASTPQPASAPAVNTGTPSRDERACLQGVTAQTRNPEVVLLTGTETSEANNTVYIGVGPNRAKWRCLVKNGRVAEVMSMTNEGRL